MKGKWIRTTVSLALLLVLVMEVEGMQNVAATSNYKPRSETYPGQLIVPLLASECTNRIYVTQGYNGPTHTGQGDKYAFDMQCIGTPTYSSFTCGKTVVAAADGWAYVINDVVLIDHGSNYYTQYVHVDPDSSLPWYPLNFNIPDDQVNRVWVSQGDLVATVACPGGNHLHFEVAKWLGAYRSIPNHHATSQYWGDVALGHMGSGYYPETDQPDAYRYITIDGSGDSPNQPPTADAGGPYTANEGEAVVLDASGSSDSDGVIVNIGWDCDGDGVYDDATGQTALCTWGDDYAGIVGVEVTDDDEATDTATTTVTVSNVAPTVEAGPNQTVFRNDVVALSCEWTDPAGSLDEPYSWTWDVTGDGIADHSGSAPYGSVASASTSFAMEGIYTLTCAVTDKDGGAGSDSIVVEVLNRPPDCSAAAPSIKTIWPPNHKFVRVSVLGVTDPEGDPISITIDRIRQDEPVDTVGNGKFSPDGKGVGTDTARIRAERMGTKKVSGNGRVYHISFSADDGHGGSCSREVLVGVPHDRRGRPAVDDSALYDSTTLAP